jgi:hypothetical protein
MLTKQEIKTRLGLGDGRAWFVRADGLVVDAFDTREYDANPNYRRITPAQLADLIDGKELPPAKADDAKADDAKADTRKPSRKPAKPKQANPETAFDGAADDIESW